METKAANKEQLQSCTLPNGRKVYFEESERSYFEGLLEDIAKPAPCPKLREIVQKQKIHEIVSSTADRLGRFEPLIDELDNFFYTFVGSDDFAMLEYLNRWHSIDSYKELRRMLVGFQSALNK